MAKATMTTQPEAGQGSPLLVNPSQPAESGAPIATPAVQNGQPAQGFDLDAIVKAIRPVISDSLNEFTRSQQSQRDKLEARINQRFNATLQTLQGVGLSPTPEQQNALANQVRAQVEAEESPAVPQPAQAGAAPTVPQPASQPAAQPEDFTDNPQTKLSWGIMDAYGVEIDATDPEARMIDYSTPAAIIKTTTEAIQAKQVRAARAGLPLANGPADPNPIANIKDPDELWQRARKGIK